MSEKKPRGTAAPALRPRRRKVGVIGVLGELFITAGVFVLLFIGWQVWLNDIIVGAEQTNAASELSQQWEDAAPTEEPVEPAPDPDAGATPEVPAGEGEPVVAAAPGAAESFANIIIPRLGSDYIRSIAEGTGANVINNREAGVGHYEQSQMPGEVGNFAVAAHRTTYGAPFHDIEKLVVGDSIIVETQDGWYKYIYRGTQYVRPTGVDVLLPVPQFPGVAATDRVITMTSCHPKLSSAERIIAFGVFDSWYPRSGGAPTEISTLAQAGGN